MTEINRPRSEDVTVDELFNFASGALLPERTREIEKLATKDPELAARIQFMQLLNPPDEEDEEAS